ncbi:MAG: GNAT family N-acetyltransferase [Phycisphaeraceae bacterium]
MNQADSAVERALRYWSGFFGLPPEQFAARGTAVVPHRGLEGYVGAWIFQRSITTIVSVPAGMVGAVRDRLGSTSPPLEPDADWAGLLGARVERVIGPAYQGYLDRVPEPDAAAPGVERLKRSDHQRLASLERVCGPEAWSHANLDLERDEPIFGCVAEGRLVAVAQNSRWGEQTVSPGVVTAPAWRNQGLGRAVLAAAMRDAWGHGELVLYQSLVANRPAVTIGEALGVRPFAQHVAVRFRAAR